MVREIPDGLLGGLSELVTQRTGLHFPPERWPDLKRGVQSALIELGHTDLERAAESLLNGSADARQLEMLARHLTIGETYFLRDPRVLEVLEKEVLPELIRTRRLTERRLRIWSAGCCTGEEPYSLAMLLHHVLPDIDDWQITILATDINTRSLQKAEGGVYSKWSFRGVSDEIKTTCFHATPDGHFTILPKYQRLVAFSFLNLAENTFPSLANNTNAMDLIVCRNVLMYFSPAQTKRAIANLGKAIVEGGWLITSAAEAGPHFAPLTPVAFPGAILYRKTSGSLEKTKPATATTPLPEPAGGCKDPGLTGAAQSDPPAPAPAPITDLPSTVLDSVDEASLAREKADKGKLSDALKYCEMAIAREKLNPRLHYLKGAILQEQNSLTAASTAFRRALFIDANFVIAQFALGMILHRQGKLKDAGNCFRIALGIVERCQPEEIVPESDGITAQRLADTIRSMQQIERTAS